MSDRIVIHPPKKDSSGKWTVTVSYYVNGKRKQKRKTGFDRSKEAKAAGEEIKKRLEESMPAIIANGTEVMTLRKFAEEYKDIKKKTWAHRTSIERMRSIEHCDFADKPLLEIRVLEIEKNVARLQDIYKYNTVSSIMAGWNVFLNAAVSYDYLTKNPNTVKLEKPKKTKELHALSLDQVETMVKKITNPDIYLLTRIGYMCGLRRSEAVDLKLSDFDFTNKLLTVSHQLADTDQGWMRGRPLKTNNSYRTIPVPDKLLQEIKTHPVIGMEGHLFITDPLNLPGKASKIYKKLGYPISYHAMRHTYVTNLITSNQFDLQSVAKLAGDAVKTILSTYSHYLEQTQEENAKKINRLFGS